MLIASLERITRRGDTAYAASDPFDGELLTEWHGSILQVEGQLRDDDSKYGLMTACYQGESDVPARISEEEPFEPCCESGLAECNSVYCQ